VDRDSPCQFTCCNVQILHLYTDYIYLPILPYCHRTLDYHGSPGPLSCLLNNKHELAHTAIRDVLILDTDIGHLCTFCICKVASTTLLFCIYKFRLTCFSEHTNLLILDKALVIGQWQYLLAEREGQVLINWRQALLRLILDLFFITYLSGLWRFSCTFTCDHLICQSFCIDFLCSVYCLFGP